MFDRLKIFFQESKQEFNRVNWPTKESTIRYTLFVIGISVALAAFLGLFDYIFLQVLERAII